MLLSLQLLLAAALGPLGPALGFAAAAAALVELARREPEHTPGHRAGAEGFEGTETSERVCMQMPTLQCACHKRRVWVSPAASSTCKLQPRSPFA